MQEYCNTNRRKGKHLTFGERNQILAMLRINMTITEIAKSIGVHRKTIEREIKRGMVNGLQHSDLSTYSEYSPEKAQKLYDDNQRKKQGTLKINKNIELAEFIEKSIIEEKKSPYATLESAKRDGLEVNISLRTLYNYIYTNLFIKLNREHLPYNKKRRYKSQNIRKRIRKMGGKSIETRPAEVNNRETFGHWEMDTVVGRRTGGFCLLVLTERKTRKQIVRMLEKKTSKCVVEAMEELAKNFSIAFNKTFLSITVDNGSEFMNAEAIERLGVKDVYYAHSYCSYERGSNENANKLIRRFIPKGVKIENYTKKQIEEIETWINNMPRKMFNGATSEELYQKEIRNILK